MQIKFVIDTDRFIGPFKRSLATWPRRLGILLSIVLAPMLVYAAVTKPYSFSDGQAISAAQVNSNFDTVYTAVNNLELQLQKVACEGRRGVWQSDNTCLEFAYYTGQCTFTNCSCQSGYHMCSFVDLFTGGFESLRRPGYSNSQTYAWVAGSYTSAKDSFFYPWGQGNSLQCSSGSHYMIDMRRSASGNTAWGCYPDSYTSASAMCCRDNQ